MPEVVERERAFEQRELERIGEIDLKHVFEPCFVSFWSGDAESLARKAIGAYIYTQKGRGGYTSYPSETISASHRWAIWFSVKLTMDSPLD